MYACSHVIGLYMYYLAVSREHITIQVLIRICTDKKVDCFGVNWVTLLMCMEAHEHVK